MSNLNDVSRELLEAVLKTVEAKNADYCGGDTDPLKNMRLSEDIGLCSTETAIMSRMMDKVQRLVNLLNGHEPRVKAESIRDTMEDLIGYVLLLNYTQEAK